MKNGVPQQQMRVQGPVKLVGLLLAGVLWLLLASHEGALQPGSPSPVQLKNIAPAAGVHFVLNNSATPRKFQIEPMVAGVAVLDFNNDGRPFRHRTPRPRRC